MPTHATIAEYVARIGDSPTGLERMLDNASALISNAIVVLYDQTDEHNLAALRNATCEQVAWWVEGGDPHGVAHQFESMTAGKTTVKASAQKLAPRAYDLLAAQGLMGRSVLSR